MIAIETELTAFCRRALPDWSALRITEVTPLAPSPPRPVAPSPRRLIAPSPLRSLALAVEGGSGGQSYRRELVWRCHAEREPRWTLDDRERAEREYLLLRALEARGFPVPHAYGWGREGGGWVLMEKAPGRPVGRGVAARRDALRWLDLLHAINSEGIRQAPLPHVTLVGTLARAKAWGEEAGCAALRDTAESLCRRAALPESAGHLLHGNARPDCFRVEGGRVAGWLGWGSAALGDPRWDLAGFLAGASENGRAAGPPREPGVSRPEPLAPGPALRIYAAALALRDWSAAACRTTRLTRERGAEHPSVLGRAPLVDRARRHCLAAMAALDVG